MRTTTSLAVTATLLLAVPALAGCGTNDGDEAKGAMQDAVRALGRYDGEAFCNLRLTEDNSKPLKDDSSAYEKCRKAVEAIKTADGSGDLGKLKDANVKKATVDGEKATVSLADIEGLDLTGQRALSGGTDAASTYELRKVGGHWYVATQPAPSPSSSAPTPTGTATPAATGTSKPAATGTARPGATGSQAVTSATSAASTAVTSASSAASTAVSEAATTAP